MNRRPRREDTEEDILRMEQAFLAEKIKNPELKPSALMVKAAKAPKKSIFAQAREKQQQQNAQAEAEAVHQKTAAASSVETQIFHEIHEKMIGDAAATEKKRTISNIVLGNVVEKKFAAPKVAPQTVDAQKQKILKDIEEIKFRPAQKRSIFALSVAANATTPSKNSTNGQAEAMDTTETLPVAEENLRKIYGKASAVIDDANVGEELHEENIQKLAAMNEAEIMQERQRLIENMDPAVLAMLAKKRKAKDLNTGLKNAKASMPASDDDEPDLTPEQLGDLPPPEIALSLLKRSTRESWLHFDKVERDKLDWMRDIPMQAQKLKPGQAFEARFDWQGILLAYTMEEEAEEAPCNAKKAKKQRNKKRRDERDLYMHAADPHRPGYTLQELFRLARSQVMQQRHSAFSAIAGILNLYNKGFYDNVLELPISKIFFLLRFGFDEQTPAMLEATSNALAMLFFNETDEMLLNCVADNYSCHWQPCLRILVDDENDDKPKENSIEALQKHMKQLEIGSAKRAKPVTTVKVNLNEREEESKTTMSDFQLAETDLVECLWRTNILQRIRFVLCNIKPNNSTVHSCIKLLIRLARYSQEYANKISDDSKFMRFLFKYFLPPIEKVDAAAVYSQFYDYPQHLFVKLVRVLIAQNIKIGTKFIKLGLMDKLENLLFHRQDMQFNLIQVQIEAYRILRLLLLYGLANDAVYIKFMPSFRFMLEWHFNHVNYNKGGSLVIRQHAAALLAAISSGPSNDDTHMLLGQMLLYCCCSWFQKATRDGVQEFSQGTLLAACLNAAYWLSRNNSVNAERLQSFIDKYLRVFLASETFVQLMNALISTSLLLQKSKDRRMSHPPLPNLGAVVLGENGPQFAIDQKYPVYMLAALWRFLSQEWERDATNMPLLQELMRKEVVMPLIRYLNLLHINTRTATNFFAKQELNFVFDVLNNLNTSREFMIRPHWYHIVYNFICVLTAEHIPMIESLFDTVIFNSAFLSADQATLQRWKQIYLNFVYMRCIALSPEQLTFTLPHKQEPALTRDWPYKRLEIILHNYINASKMQPQKAETTEKDLLLDTYNLITKIEEFTPRFKLVMPRDKLMWFMISFMGTDNAFLDAEVEAVLRKNLLQFYADCKDYKFEFDDKKASDDEDDNNDDNISSSSVQCKFDNLYALFIEQFQFASYGSELFSSLVLVPLAQKYDSKLRRRVWSDYAYILRFLNCDESLLIGGLQSYLEPAELDESMIESYADALQKDLLKPNTLPHKIATHHFQQFRKRATESQAVSNSPVAVAQTAAQ